MKLAKALRLETRRLRQPRRLMRMLKWRIQHGNGPKVFCIGRNKTGTTSLKLAMNQLGFFVGDQKEAELIFDRHYLSGNFAPIIRYCRYYQAFQDAPFSFPETYKHLDRAFPGSKFILTQRDSPEQWYASISRFHSKIFGGGQLPTHDVLKAVKNDRDGYPGILPQLYGTSNEDPYNAERMIKSYRDHNEDVLTYFKDRPEDLLVVNVAEKGAYKTVADFLGAETTRLDFPWENKT